MAEHNVNLMDPRMLEILKGANKLIKKVETGDYEKGNINPDALITEGHDSFISEEEALQKGVVKPTRTASKNDTSLDELDNEAYAEKVRKSGLPAPIQEAMIKKRIETPNNSAVSLDTVKAFLNDEGEKSFKPRTPKDIKQIKTTSTINENRNVSGNEMITIGRNELKGIIKDTLIEYLSGEYSKTLTEGVIKQTINTLIKEGKLTVKKKI